MNTTHVQESASGRNPERTGPACQHLLVLQQNGSAHAKIAGIKEYGEGLFSLEIISIDECLPPIIDDARDYLPKGLNASLVLDFLTHPDLSEDLATLCLHSGIPMVASGKKLRTQGVLTPPT